MGPQKDKRKNQLNISTYLSPHFINLDICFVFSSYKPTTSIVAMHLKANDKRICASTKKLLVRYNGIAIKQLKRIGSINTLRKDRKEDANTRFIIT